MEELQRRVQDYLAPVERKTKGYQGFLLLDHGDGQRLALLPYDSVADVRAAQAALTLVGSEHSYTLMS